MPVLLKKKPQSKAEFTRERIKAMALRLNPSGKLPTVRELRRSLGVGTSSIMDALWDLERAGVINRKHGSGLYVSPQSRQKTIGLVLSRHVLKSGVSPFHSMLVHLCEQRTQSHHEHFVFYINLPQAGGKGEPLLNRKNFVEDVSSGRLHGILRTYEMTAAEQAWLREKNVPLAGFVCGTRDAAEIVDIDWAELTRWGVKALAAQGCRRMGLITTFGFLRHIQPVFKEDIRGYREALRRAGLEFRPSWIWEKRIENWPAEQPEWFARWDTQGREAMESLFGKNRANADAPDGLVITDDLMAHGVLMAARQMGLAVGKDIQIATHANKGSPLLKLCESPLTLLEVDPSEIVEALFKMLENLMEGGAPPRKLVLIKPRVLQVGVRL